MDEGLPSSHGGSSSSGSGSDEGDSGEESGGRKEPSDANNNTVDEPPDHLGALVDSTPHTPSEVACCPRAHAIPNNSL